MRFKEISESTVAGAIAPVESAGFVKMKTRGPVVYGDTTPQDLVKKKKKGQYSNSIAEGKQVDEAKLEEEDIIVIPGHSGKRKTGFVPRGQSRVDHEVEMARSDLLATLKNAKALYELLEHRSEEEGLEGWVQEKIIKASDYLNAVKEYYDEKSVQQEGAKVDRMVKHIEKSERKLGKSKDEAENIAWATANKRGMLDNKNKKKGK